MNSSSKQINIISIGTANLSSLLQEVAKYPTINDVLKVYPEGDWFKITSLYISQMSEIINQSIGWGNKKTAW